METTDDEKLTRRGITLSEQQWRLVKGHAAQRGQTISEWFQDVVREAGLGQSPYARYPTPMTNAEISGTVNESHMEDGVRVIDKVTLLETSIVKDPPPGQEFRPVPKPGGKKK